MADIKISQLGAAQAISDSDNLVVDTGSVTLKAAASLVKEYSIGDNNISALGDGSVTGAILNVKSTSETADSNIAETMAKNGAHNLLNHDIASQSLSGLTVSVADDKSITVSGATNNAGYLVSSYLITGIKAGVNYKFGGFPTDLAEYSAYLERADGGSSVSLGDFVGANTTYRLVVFFSGSFTTGGNPITFKPMITLASDPSTEYAPYAMTNAELTEYVIQKTDTFSSLTTGTNGTGLLFSSKNALILECYDTGNQAIIRPYTYNGNIYFQAVDYSTGSPREGTYNIFVRYLEY